MKKRTHKILSWLLTIAMVLGLLPAMSLPAAAVTTICFKTAPFISVNFIFVLSQFTLLCPG